MAVIKFNKCTFDEWKKEMEEDTEMDGLFMKDVMIAKVDDNTAIMCADVFDRELQKTMLSDPAFIEMSEMMGIEHVECEIKPVQAPQAGSTKPCGRQLKDKHKINFALNYCS